jgi:hypothetical protein
VNSYKKFKNYQQGYVFMLLVGGTFYYIFFCKTSEQCSHHSQAFMDNLKYKSLKSKEQIKADIAFQ